MNTTAEKCEAPLLEMMDVTITASTRTDTPEIENVNWRLLPGDFWVIGGVHGAGKSDFLATAAGLQRPLRGMVQWFGRDIAELAEQELVDERMRIGLVFENGGRMLRHLTVAENVALPLRYHRDLGETEAVSELKEILELTDLTSRAATTSGTLSPSWQQRVGLARALVLKPEVLLLDKPIVGLGHLRWWLDFLPKLSAGISFTGGKSMALAITTDDMNPWIQVGRQFAVLKQHRWHLLGGRAELAGKSEPLLRELWAEEAQ